MRQPTYTEDFRNIEKRFIFQGGSPFGNSLADAIEGLQAENAELRRLIKEVAIPAMQKGLDWSEQTLSGYGFYRPSNPHNFSPDPDCCTPKEIANHKAACEAFDKGAYTPDNSDGWIAEGLHVTTAPWGIGGYTDTDDSIESAIATLQEAVK